MTGKPPVVRRKSMEEDLIKKKYFSERDTQTGLWLHFPRKRIGWKKLKYRDLIRKVAFGINFAVIGMENQEEVHYLMPLRTMVYDAGEYENQVAQIRKRVKKIRGITRAEYLSGFTKDGKLAPCITFVLYYGDEWDGARNLHEILDFTDIPEPLRDMVGNYQINLLDIKKLQDTSVFKTDIKQVFDFIRLSEDKEKLLELVENDSSYKQMEEDAYDVAISFTKSEKLIAKQNFQEGGKVDMCKALVELRAEGVREGVQEGMHEGIRGTVAIMKELGYSVDIILEKVKKQFQLTDEQLKEYVKEEETISDL